jgi:two-component system NarL family response regulator
MRDDASADPTGRPLRILLADDNRLMVEGLTNLLAAYEMEVTGVASNGLEAVELAQALRPDLILMDIRMPGCNGLEATRRIKARQPEIKIVMLTTSAEEADLFESIKSGATGYLIKSMSGAAFIEALLGLGQGIPPFSPGLAVRLLSEFARLAENAERKTQAPAQPAQLTDRELDVLRLVSSGLTYKEVGSQLSLSERTVRYHMAQIMERLHLEHRSQVIAYAGERGLEHKSEH